MNSITKEFENFSRKVIEHARGSNGGFETGMQAGVLHRPKLCSFCTAADNCTPSIAPFCFFPESPFCPWMPRDASCYGPTSRRQPTRRGSCSDSTKNLLVQYVIAALTYFYHSQSAAPLVTTLEFLWRRRAVHRFNDSHRDCRVGRALDWPNFLSLRSDLKSDTLPRT